MKIVCDKCATKYSIADDKVRGKVFKIRCKKCSHIIVVKGNEGGETGFEGGADGDDGATVAGGLDSGAGGTSGDRVWYLVIGGEQVGPLSASDVGAKHASGEADSETYGWREGFGDWLRLGSIEELAGSLGSRGANGTNGAHGANGGETRRTDINDMFGAQATTVEDSGGDDLFGAAAVRHGSDARSTSAAPHMSAAPAPADVGSDGKLTGQRNENSVLFSLSNLQAMATANAPSKASSSASFPERPGYATSKNEGSGLIDIRAMAAATLSAVSTSPNDHVGADIPSFSAAPVFSPVVQPPVMLPMAQSSETPRWIWAVVGIGGVAVLGLLSAVAFVITRAPNNPPAQAAVTTPSPSGSPSLAVPAAAAVALAAANPTTPVAAPPGEAPRAAAAERDANERRIAAAKHVAPVAKVGRPGAPVAAAAPVAARPAAAAPAPSAPSKPVGGKKSDSLDSLLDEAVAPGSTPKHVARTAAPPPPADDANLPEQLDRPSVMGGMKMARVQGCFDQFKVPGTAIVAVVIGKSGHIKSANVGGALAGTPTGDCVARAVKAVSFKPFKGNDMSISYPFILR